MSCSRTQHGGGRSRTQDLSLRSPTLYHWATALPVVWIWVGSDVSLRSYSPLSVPIDFEWGKWCLHLFSITMNSVFIKLTGKEDRHKISDEFEFRSYLTIHFGVTCPWAVKKNDVSSFSHSPLIGSFSNSQVTRTGITVRTSSNLGRIGLFTSELSPLSAEFCSHRFITEKMMTPLFRSYYELNLHQTYR